MAQRPSVPVSRATQSLASQANGAAAVYWSPVSSHGSFQLCVAILLSAYAVVLNNAKYRIRGQYSIDGVTWENLGTDGYIDGETGYITATGLFDNQYSGEQSEFGALLRVGLEIASVNGTSQGYAQINLDAAPLDTALVKTTRLKSGTLASGTDQQLGSNLNSTPFAKARVFVELTAAPAASLIVTIMSGKGDALAKVATVTLATTDTTASVEATTLGDVVAVYYSTLGGWADRTAIVDITLRPS